MTSNLSVRDIILSASVVILSAEELDNDNIGSIVERLIQFDKKVRDILTLIVYIYLS